MKEFKIPFWFLNSHRDSCININLSYYMLLQVAKHVIVTIGLVGVGVLIGKLSSKFIHFKQFKFVNKYLKELV